MSESQERSDMQQCQKEYEQKKSTDRDEAGKGARERKSETESEKLLP